MNKIEKLKDIEKMYQISKDWYHREKLTEKEYYEQIGEYKDIEPFEIVDDMCKIIKDL